MNPEQVEISEATEAPLQETAAQAVPDEQAQAAANQQNSYAMIETHLQVSNLMKILFTVDYNMLGYIIKTSPEELKETKHYKILEATLNYYTTVGQINTQQ